MTKTRGKFKRTKFDTDKYEIAWHPVSSVQEGYMSYNKTVWESSPYVGPQSYNAGHIDFILNSMTNDVAMVTRPDEGYLLCRQNLSKEKVKFLP